MSNITNKTNDTIRGISYRSPIQLDSGEEDKKRPSICSGLDKEDEDEPDDDEDKENCPWPKRRFIRSPAPEPEEQV
ncbi:hypothetical protein BGZ82_003932 [Podila clonocystis]|nr:hypothetical protein BGZ82_003932 [Podila clonocystis]